MSIDSDELTRLFLKFQATCELSIEQTTTVRQVIYGGDQIRLPNKLTLPLEEPKTEVEAEEQSNDLRYLIEQMDIPERLKLALFGNKQARGILILDKNRIVTEFVMKNPGIQITELEDWAKNPATPEHILREIGSSKEWMRNYGMKRAIVMNPKCPLGVSLRWVKFMNKNDLRLISRSKNLPQVLSVAARKQITEDQK